MKILVWQQIAYIRFPLVIFGKWPGVISPRDRLLLLLSCACHIMPASILPCFNYINPQTDVRQSQRFCLTIILYGLEFSFLHEFDSSFCSHLSSLTADIFNADRFLQRLWILECLKNNPLWINIILNSAVYVYLLILAWLYFLKN